MYLICILSVDDSDLCLLCCLLDVEVTFKDGTALLYAACYVLLWHRSPRPSQSFHAAHTFVDAASWLFSIDMKHDYMVAFLVL